MMAKGTATVSASASATCLQINHAASQRKNTRVEQLEMGKKIKEKRKRNAWGCGKGCQVKPSGGVKCGGN